jgi:cytidine deaminase
MLSTDYTDYTDCGKNINVTPVSGPRKICVICVICGAHGYESHDGQSSMRDVSNAALPPQWHDLITASREARSHAYAPYSEFTVGAAVLTKVGDIFSGCNVENASYGLTICAERAAACAAIATGQQDIVTVCISLTGTPIPCGTCRQFLYEFNPSMTVMIDDLNTGTEAAPETVLLSDLLPRGFRLER